MTHNFSRINIARHNKYSARPTNQIAARPKGSVAIRLQQVNYSCISAEISG